VVRTILEAYRDTGIWVTFVDLESAFDTIPRQKMINTLTSEKKVPPIYIRLLAKMLSTVRASVRNDTDIHGELKSFIENTGVKQGCTLGPTKFNKYFDDIVRVIESYKGTYAEKVKLQNRAISCLLYADDSILMSLTHIGLKKQLEKLPQYCAEKQLRVSIKKTECMYITAKRFTRAVEEQHHRETAMQPLYYKDHPLKYVEQFRYLGIYINHKGNFEDHETIMLTKMQRAMYICMAKANRLGTTCPGSLKIVMYKAYVESIAGYCAEVIPHSAGTIKKIDDIAIQYSRWVLTASKTTNRNSTMRECNLMGMVDRTNRAKATYLLRLLTRDKIHYTTSGLQDTTEKHRQQG
jgi:hypothetical protein